MIIDELHFLSPELSLIGFALLLIILDLVVKQKRILAGIAVAGLIVSIGFTVPLLAAPTVDIFYAMIAVDSYATIFKFLILGSTLFIILASQDYVNKLKRYQGEYYALLLIAALGLILLTESVDFISIFVALELSGIALYVLAGFLKDDKSSEAGLKYLLLGAVASAVLLYGMALVFGVSGKTCLPCVRSMIETISFVAGSIPNPALIMGMVLIIAGFGFKIASFPFQMWVPDVYEGAPTPVTAYLSVAGKAAGFAVLLRVLLMAFGAEEFFSMQWGIVIAVLSAITMTVGNVVAIPQTNIKRMLGYSSIAQAGYLMVGLATVGIAFNADTLGQSGLIFFLMSYILTNLGAFIAVIAISNKIESDTIADYAGMIKRAPALTIALSLCLISLIGLPPTAGLIAKIYIFSGAVQHNLLWLVVIAVINGCISVYYYLRVVKVMWLGAPASQDKVPSTFALKIALALCCLGVLLLGIIPGSFIGIAESAVKMFGL